MEAWLAQMELEMDGDVISMDHPLYNQNSQRQHQTETMEVPGVLFDEHDITAALGDLSGERNTSSPHQLDFDYALLNLQPDFSDIDPTSHLLANTNNTFICDNNSNLLQLGARADQMESVLAVVGRDDQISKSKEGDDRRDNDNDDQKQRQQVGASNTSGRSTKRKREPSQVQDHIMAERKRRELLSSQFISLSSILPDLKKMDKTTVLGEAIKYMKQLQEKVKSLEEVVAKRTVESVVVVKKSQLARADDGGADDNDSSSSVDDSCTGGSGGGRSVSLPEIEVKVSGKSMLIKLSCQKKKGMLPKIMEELEKFDMDVINCSVIPFGTLALDTTILAQIEKELSNAHVKDVIRSLGSIVNPDV